MTAVGGLTESVVKSSTAALLGWGKSIKNLKMVGVLVRFSRTLLSLFEVRNFNDGCLLQSICMANVEKSPLSLFPPCSFVPQIYPIFLLSC